MGKLKTIGTGLLIGTKALMPSEAEARLRPILGGHSDTYWKASGLPAPNIVGGTAFTMSFNKLGRFEPFGRVGISAMPFSGEEIAHGIWNKRDEQWETLDQRSSMPRLVSTWGYGMNVRINEYWKFLSSLDVGFAEGFASQKLAAGGRRRISSSRGNSLSLDAGVFIEMMRLSGTRSEWNSELTGKEDVASSLLSRRAGPEIGIKFERALTRNLSLNARVGYSHSFLHYTGILMSGLFGGHSGELTANVGLHFHLRPEITMPHLDFGGRQPRVQQPQRTARPQRPSSPPRRGNLNLDPHRFRDFCSPGQLNNTRRCR